MKLTFLGTKGYVEPATDRHRMHTSTLVTYRGRSIRIDCGEDWRGRCGETRQRAVFITHCHPDHAFGLKDGCDDPVYAPPEAWEEMSGWPIADHRTIEHRERVEIAGMSVECFRVQHSTRCPAVGYRIMAGVVTVFYAPDLVYIEDREAALTGCDAYIGDGATIDRNFVRKQKDTGELIGHTPVRTQLTWCQKLGVPRMFVTHCGSQIVKDHDAAVEKIGSYASERGVQFEIATDGMERVLR
ncbi:MAG: MBL fold metallo-hydrolase [Armatimonadota bacterium]|jgi:ribonuclease BN (tRNA processing enzyme)